MSLGRHRIAVCGAELWLPVQKPCGNQPARLGFWASMKSRNADLFIVLELVSALMRGEVDSLVQRLIGCD